MEQILAVLGRDKAYADRLSRFITSKPETPFTVYTFDDKEKLERFSAENTVDFLLMEGTSDEKLPGLPDNRVLHLSDKPDRGSNSIYKFQSGDRILKEILTCYEKNRPAVSDDTVSRLYIVFSPIGRSGKTSFALALAKALRNEGKILYVSYEEMPGLPQSIRETAKRGLSEAFFYFKEKSLTREVLRELVFQHDGVFYLNPISLPEDISVLSEKELRDFTSTLLRLSEQDAIVLDLDSIVSRFGSILPLADWIFMPVSENRQDLQKLDTFDRYLHMNQYQSAAEKIVKLLLPKAPDGGIDNGSFQLLDASPLGTYAEAVVRNYILRRPNR